MTRRSNDLNVEYSIFIDHFLPEGSPDWAERTQEGSVPGEDFQRKSSEARSNAMPRNSPWFAHPEQFDGSVALQGSGLDPSAKAHNL
jgi:hypothetical protein